MNQQEAVDGDRMSWLCAVSDPVSSDSTLIEDNEYFSRPLRNGATSPNCTLEVNGTPVPSAEKDEIRHTGSTPRSLTAENVEMTSPDMPTGDGRKSKDDEESPCTGHDVILLDAEYNFSVDHLFEMIFTDSDLYRQFTEVKETRDLEQSVWSEEVDSQGDRHRVISYTLSLNYSMSSKTSPITEKQILRSVSKAGTFYLVDTECVNSSMPNGGNFYVINRYCLHRLGFNRCQLKVTSAVRYRKSVLGVIKTDLLQEVSTIIGNDIKLDPRVGKMKVLRRQRDVNEKPQSGKHATQPPVQSTHGTGSPPGTHTHKAQGISGDHHDDRQRAAAAGVLVGVICATLMILAVFNGMMFYKLSSLEQKTRLFHLIRPEQWANTDEVHETEQGWKRMLEEQRRLHDTETGQWKDIQGKMAKLISDMQLTLESLEQRIRAKLRASSLPAIHNFGVSAGDLYTEER